MMRLLSDKKTQHVWNNFFALSVIQVFSYILPLLTIPYIIGVVGIVKYGEIAFAAAFCIYFNVVVNYGFNLTATRQIALSRDDVQQLSRVYWRIMWSKMILLLLVAVPFVLAVELHPYLHSRRFLYYFSFLVVVTNACYPRWFFQGVEEMKYQTIFSLIIKGSYIGGVFWFIRQEFDYVLVPLLSGGASVVVGLLSNFFILHKYKIRWIRIEVREIYRELKQGRFIFVNQLMPNLYNNTSTFLLGIFAGPASLGIYAAAQKVIMIGSPLVGLLSRAFFPHLSNTPDNARGFRKIMLIAVSVMALIYMLFAQTIFTTFFTPDLIEGAYLLYIMAFGLLFLGIYNAYGTNGLIHIGKERALMRNSIVSSLIGFGLSFILISYFKAYGAAATVCITRAMMAAGVFYLYEKYNLKEAEKAPYRVKNEEVSLETNLD